MVAALRLLSYHVLYYINTRKDAHRYLDLGMPAERVARGTRGSDCVRLARRRKSYRGEVESISPPSENLVLFVVGGWRSAAEVESVGEVASEGARYLRLLVIVEGGERR